MKSSLGASPWGNPAFGGTRCGLLASPGLSAFIGEFGDVFF
jgi:hypothetical protein